MCVAKFQLVICKTFVMGLRAASQGLVTLHVCMSVIDCEECESEREFSTASLVYL